MAILGSPSRRGAHQEHVASFAHELQRGQLEGLCPVDLWIELPIKVPQRLQVRELRQLLAPLSPPMAATFWFQSYNRSLPMALHSLDSAFCGLKNDHCRQCGIQEGAVDTANHIHRNRRAEQVGLVLPDDLDRVRSVTERKLPPA